MWSISKGSRETRKVTPFLASVTPLASKGTWILQCKLLSLAFFKGNDKLIRETGSDFHQRYCFFLGFWGHRSLGQVSAQMIIPGWCLPEVCPSTSSLTDSFLICSWISHFRKRESCYDDLVRDNHGSPSKFVRRIGELWRKLGRREDAREILLNLSFSWLSKRAVKKLNPDSFLALCAEAMYVICLLIISSWWVGRACDKLFLLTIILPHT